MRNSFRIATQPDVSPGSRRYAMQTTAPVLVQPRQPMEMMELDLDEPAFGEVRVKMVASGVCHSCLHAYDGSHSGMPMPMVLGDEGSGVVDGVGPGVTQLQQ